MCYGGVTEYSSTSYLNVDIYPAKWVFNASVDYYRDRWAFTLRADNIFDTYPQEAPEGSNFHGIFSYPSSSPLGSQGAFVYGKVKYSWEIACPGLGPGDYPARVLRLQQHPQRRLGGFAESEFALLGTYLGGNG